MTADSGNSRQCGGENGGLKLRVAVAVVVGEFLAAAVVEIVVGGWNSKKGENLLGFVHLL